MTTAPDLTKVVFNPSKSVTFAPVEKKQAVSIEVINNSTSDVAVKFKNTGPNVYKTQPPQAKIGVGEKKVFKCIFKGLPKEKCKTNDRFTVVYIAASKNVVIEKAWKNAHKTCTMKHKIAILFQGVNDQKENETQQPTNNDDDEDKDRQGQLRSKSKVETAKGKKATVVMFVRKEGDSVSDEEDDEGAVEGAEHTNSAGVATSNEAGNMSELRTTRPAGAFTGVVASNDNPMSELRTTRPAGNFSGQTASTPGGAVDPKSMGLKTTRPAGAFTGQVASNGSTDGQELRTTKPAGTYDNPQKKNQK